MADKNRNANQGTAKGGNKERVVAWLPPDMIQQMTALEPLHNKKNHSEFILWAVDFYIGYLSTQNATTFLCNALKGVIEGNLQLTEQRVANNLFRLSVETSMMMHLLATTLEVTDDELYRLRGRCVSEVKKTKGRVSLDAVVKFQQGIEL